MTSIQQDAGDGAAVTREMIAMPVRSKENVQPNPCRLEMEHERSDGDERQSAVAKVFETVELLDMILVQLDVDMLRIVQRVCKGWWAAVQESAQMQKKLFQFSATSFDEVLALGMVNKDSDVYKVGESFHLLNPDLILFDAHAYLEASPAQHFCQQVLTCTSPERMVNKSCEEIYISQPPLDEISVFVSSIVDKDGICRMPTHLTHNGDMRLGRVLETVRQKVHEKYGDDVQWDIFRFDVAGSYQIEHSMD